MNEDELMLEFDVWHRAKNAMRSTRSTPTIKQNYPPVALANLISAVGGVREFQTKHPEYNIAKIIRDYNDSDILDFLEAFKFAEVATESIISKLGDIIEKENY